MFQHVLVILCTKTKSKFSEVFSIGQSAAVLLVSPLESQSSCVRLTKWNDSIPWFNGFVLCLHSTSPSSFVKFSLVVFSNLADRKSDERGALWKCRSPLEPIPSQDNVKEKWSTATSYRLLSLAVVVWWNSAWYFFTKVLLTKKQTWHKALSENTQPQQG